jgi:hypothetical protein
VFNSGARIPTKGKHLWTFYGPDGKYWNHYGDLEMMGYDDKPTDPFRPVLARYKGKIYPVNRIHSAWPAIEVEGETALMQPKMGDIYKMWKSHQADATKYPDLAKITDDDGDSVPEVNRPEEIDALIHSVSQMLAETDYPMQGKHVVWAMDDRVYTSGTNFRTLDMHPWEASPYANVHKYNHDISPAHAALGMNGCTDCHHPKSAFFFASTVKYVFDESAQPVTQPQYRLLGLSPPAVRIGAWREAYLKPVTYGMIVALCLGIVAMSGGMALRWTFEHRAVPAAIRVLPAIIAVSGGIGALMLLRQPRLMAYMLPSRFWLDSNHFLFVAGVLIVGLVGLLWEVKQRMQNDESKRSRLGSLTRVELLVSLPLACVAGAFVFFNIPGFESVTRFSYTILDLAVALVVLGSLLSVLRQTGYGSRERAG